MVSARLKITFRCHLAGLIINKLQTTLNRGMKRPCPSVITGPVFNNIFGISRMLIASSSVKLVFVNELIKLYLADVNQALGYLWAFWRTRWRIKLFKKKSLNCLTSSLFLAEFSFFSAPLENWKRRSFYFTLSLISRTNGVLPFSIASLSETGNFSWKCPPAGSEVNIFIKLKIPLLVHRAWREAKK